jgi:uncharacterized protein YceK
MKKIALFLAVWTIAMSLCGCSTVCRVPVSGLPGPVSHLVEETEPAQLVLAEWQW